MVWFGAAVFIAPLLILGAIAGSVVLCVGRLRMIARGEPEVGRVRTPIALFTMTILGFVGATSMALAAIASLFQDDLTVTTAWGSTDSAPIKAAAAAFLFGLSALTFWRDRRAWLVLTTISVVLFVVGVVYTKDGGAAVLPELIVLALPSTRAHARVTGNAFRSPQTSPA